MSCSQTARFPHPGQIMVAESGGSPGHRDAVRTAKGEFVREHGEIGRRARSDSCGIPRES
jgi:hypothetical protein